MRSFLNILGFVVPVILLTFFSCEKDHEDVNHNQCNVSNPIEELDWLKEEIDTLKQDVYSYYVMATYEGEPVFYYGNCNPAANYVSIVKNCEGDHIDYTNHLKSELTDITIIWKHEASNCYFTSITD